MKHSKWFSLSCSSGSAPLCEAHVAFRELSLYSTVPDLLQAVPEQVLRCSHPARLPGLQRCVQRQRCKKPVCVLAHLDPQTLPILLHTPQLHIKDRPGIHYWRQCVSIGDIQLHDPEIRACTITNQGSIRVLPWNKDKRGFMLVSCFTGAVTGSSEMDDGGAV